MLQSRTGGPSGPRITTSAETILPLLALAARQEREGRVLGDHHLDRVLAHADEDRRAGLTAAWCRD
jgi:hypothetical protein